MNNNLIFNQRVEEEAIKIFNKFLEYIKDQQNVIKFVDYVNTIITDRNNFSDEECKQIIESVLSKIFVAYSVVLSNQEK